MEVARKKAARRSLWRIWVFAGLRWSTAFLGIATGAVWLLGVEGAQTFQLALTLALVVCGGTYGVIYVGTAIVLIVKRFMGQTGI